jgi:hypothetical protein
MWTLSAEKSLYQSSAGIRLLHKRFNSFRTHLLQIYPRLQYFRISEIGDKGNPHFHVLVNQFLEHSVVQHLWKNYTGGTQVRFDALYGNNIGGYLSKYLTKGGDIDNKKQQQFYRANVRRYGCSRSFRPLERMHYDNFKASWFLKETAFEKFPQAVKEFLNAHKHKGVQILSHTPHEITVEINDNYKQLKDVEGFLAEQVVPHSSEASSVVQ